jgi:hypothetical protein
MVVARKLPEQGLLLLADMARDNRLVVLRPRLEEWILAAANEAGLDVRAYGLPRTPRQLHGAINTNLDKFERLLHVLGARLSPRLKTLGELLS